MDLQVDAMMVATNLIVRQCKVAKVKMMLVIIKQQHIKQLNDDGLVDNMTLKQ